MCRTPRSQGLWKHTGAAATGFLRSPYTFDLELEISHNVVTMKTISILPSLPPHSFSHYGFFLFFFFSISYFSKLLFCHEFLVSKHVSEHFFLFCLEMARENIFRVWLFLQRLQSKIARSHKRSHVCVLVLPSDLNKGYSPEHKEKYHPTYSPSVPRGSRKQWDFKWVCPGPHNSLVRIQTRTQRWKTKFCPSVMQVV